VPIGTIGMGELLENVAIQEAGALLRLWALGFAQECLQWAKEHPTHQCTKEAGQRSGRAALLQRVQAKVQEVPQVYTRRADQAERVL
jgi:hypothetical protein